MHSFFTFSKTNEPFAGTLRPYTQLLSSSPISSGFDHLEKSEFGIACRLVGVSMVSGRIVTTFPLITSFFSAFSAKLVAKQCTPALARAQPIISGWGYLQTDAAPVNTTNPFGLRYLVARWAASKLGQRLTSFINFTFCRQSSSLMLPPVHPPAVTKMASYFIPIFFTFSMVNLLLSATELSFLRTIFCLA